MGVDYCQNILKKQLNAPSVMIWGGITHNGHAGLYFLEQNEKVNAKRYIENLDEKVKIHMEVSGATVFRHDSAPAHAAKVVQNWFKENNVAVLDWLSNSPDLNCIENGWAFVKNKVSERQSTSLNNLCDVIKQV